MEMNSASREAALARSPRNPVEDEAMPEQEAPQGGGEIPVPVSDIAMYLQAILPSLPAEQQEAVAQAAEILASASGAETPQEVPVESDAVSSNEMGGVPARQ